MPTKEVFLDINETTGSMGFGGEASDDANVVRYDFYGPVYFRGGVMGQTAYSTNEVDTGNNWIDGRPIYRTVIRGASMLTNAQGAFATLPSEPENIIDMRLFVNVNREGWRPIPNTYYDSLGWSCNVYMNGATIYLGFGSSWTEHREVVVIVEYTKSSDPPTYYYLPFLASNNDQGCVASASSTFSADNQAFKAFNGIITGTNSWWASAGADTDRWVQVEMPYALKNMVVTLTDREDVSGDHRRANTAGAFLGSNDGSDWVQLFSFTDRNPNFVNNFATTYQLNNATAYKYLRYAPAAGSYSSDFASSVADIRIEGEVVDA